MQMLWQGPLAGVVVAFVIVRLLRRRAATRPPFCGAKRLELLVAAAKPRLQRQVFISHTSRDEDAKVFAASILKPALEAAGLKAYMDFSELQPGCEWPNELVSAAANSMVFVAVLSKHYCERFWCMLELDLALNAHAVASTARGSSSSDSSSRLHPLVIPVFYDHPGAVCHGNHPTRCHTEGHKATSVLQQWSSQAMHARLQQGQLSSEWAEYVDTEQWAANLAAMKEWHQHLRRGAGGPKDQDWQLAQAAVEAAVQRMPRVALDLGAGVVGLEAQRGELLARLEACLGLWLWGIGGIGKTTTAKDLVNCLSNNFIYSAVVELQKEDGNTAIAEHLTAVLKRMGSKGVSSDGVSVLSARWKEWVVDKKVLYVLDNVWTASQLNALLPVEWGPGSVVIVTSRFERFFDSDTYQQVQERLAKAQVGLLAKAHARQLLSWAAGLAGVPREPALQHQEAAILKVCGGLPLALRLAGGALRNKQTAAEWQEVYEALQQGEVAGDSENRLQGVVALSLSPQTHPTRISMFLDVATLLRGWPVDIALAVWRRWWGPVALSHFEDLKRGSLVAVDEGGALAMHDVLVALGRGIVLQATPGFEQHWGSRVWVEDDQAVGLQQAQDARQKVVAARLHRPSGKAANLASSPLHQLDLTNARILWLDGVELPTCSPKVHLLHLHPPAAGDIVPWLHDSHGLVFVRARCQRMPCLPADALPRLRSLAVLDLAWCQQLASLPETFGQLSSLRNLNLRHSVQLSGLPESFGKLSALQELNLQGCIKLASLPDSVGQLAALQKLTLSKCQRLRRLPESLGQLPMLQELHLNECVQLGNLPRSFGQLSMLQTLHLDGCWELASLPPSFGQLSVLQRLYLAGCNQLASLPDSFGQLCGLTELHMSGCEQLASMPESFGQLGALHKLDMSWCKHLSSLPESFGQLSELQWLELSGCIHLTSLPESFGKLSALRHLCMTDCHQLACLPQSFGDLAALHKLDLSWCQQLSSLPESFGQLSALQYLSLSGCITLSSLPESFGQLSQLQLLYLKGCKQLTSLPDSFGRLSALQKLTLANCASLASLPDSLGQLSALRAMLLVNCSQLAGLPNSVGEMSALGELNLPGCALLMELPESLGQLQSLWLLDLRQCPKLTPLPECIAMLQQRRGSQLRLRLTG